MGTMHRPVAAPSTILLNPRNLLHPNSWANVGEDAIPTFGSDRSADVLSPGDQVQIDVGPPAGVRRGIERLFGFVGYPCLHPSQPVRNAVDVRIDADVALALEPDRKSVV